jgi:hypothetical protein
MKFKLLVNVITLTIVVGCSTLPADKVKGTVTKYIKDKVKNPNSYLDIHFSGIDTTFEKDYKDSLMLQYKPDYKYSVEHVYGIENSDKEKVKMTVAFHFDSTLKIIGTSPDGLNGDNGQLTGNVYWKYNNYVGNKPDAGSFVELYSIDTLRKDVRYETTCDVMGNFKLDKVITGWYLMIVHSENTTSSPNDQLQSLLYYSHHLSQLWGYDIYKSNESDLRQYRILDSLYSRAIVANEKDYGSLSKKIDAYRKIEKQKIDVAGNIINKFPKEFCSKIGLYGLYSKKINITTVKINEGKTANEVVDFGITYF